MQDIQKDLPMAMAMAGLAAISWYIGVEINISLFLLFKRRHGLYFWSCALASWGVILQPLFMILADFDVWKDPVPSLVMIYITWFIMVIPQSWVLYSRLHLLMRDTKTLQIIKYVLIFNSVVFSIPTMIIGTLAVSSYKTRRKEYHYASLLTQRHFAASHECQSHAAFIQSEMGSNSAHYLLRSRICSEYAVHLPDV